MRIGKALAGDLVAARWALLCLIGKPGKAVWPDAIAAMDAATAQVAVPPSPRPVDRDTRLDLVARALAEGSRARRGAIPAPVLADVDTPF
jgi:hypothetical protein